MKYTDKEDINIKDYEEISNAYSIIAGIFPTAKVLSNWGFALTRIADCYRTYDYDTVDYDEEVKKSISIYERGIKLFRDALEKDSNYIMAINNLGAALLTLFTLTDIKNYLIEGIEICEKAYSFDNRYSYPLAWGYALNDDEDKALLLLKESLEMNRISYNVLIEDWIYWRKYLGNKLLRELYDKYYKKNKNV